MADDAPGTAGGSAPAAEDAALQAALAAAHGAVWGYGVVGSALPADVRGPVSAAEQAHRDVRDELTRLLTTRRVDPVAAEAAYALPFPVLSPIDAAALAVTLEDGAARAWTWVLDQATERSTRELAVARLADAEVRAVGWRGQAARAPVTTAFPGLPEG
ncbi:ferritin-like domain-containing protein [Modestobacter versicolor]|uniref:ferritin-like domain-containing protein n=1 Tax=Modestobacter versicolor TaxID=429133 RepID=UPI0034DF28DB